MYDITVTFSLFFQSLLERLDRQKAMLTASALVNSYCKTVNCQEDTDIKDIVKGVVTLLSRTSDEQQVRET